MLLLLLAMAGAVEAAPLDSRLQAVLAGADDARAIPIIVTLKDGVEFSRLPSGPRQLRRAELVRTLKRRAEAAQGPVREFLRGRGGERIRDLWIINGLAVTATPEVIRAIAVRPEVESVRYDEAIHLPKVTPAAVTGPAEPNIELVNAPQLWALGFTGLGVTVATMDSGVDVNHPDIGPRWRGGSNSWFDPNGEHPVTPDDVDGHGTGVMGILLGGNAGGTVIGVAPEAQWIAVKIFNDAGAASLSVIHEGFGWLLDPDGNPATDDAPDVVNNSWGFEDAPGLCSLFAREFQPDVQALKAAGIAVVFAAGNTGPNPGTSVAPANYPEAFAVGSVGTSQSSVAISDFSARGPSACDATVYPELVAPGFIVRTTDLTFGGVIPNSYVHVAGTSFAAPHVTGAMALLLSAFPGTPVGDLEAALAHSAVDLGIVGPDNTFGHGLVDAFAAYNVLSGVPDLAVIDPVPPEDDLSVNFGNVPPGQSAVLALTLRNAGSGLLDIQSVGGLLAPFALAADGCSGQTLASGDSCTVTVRFLPPAHALFTSGMEIASDDPDENPLTVALRGAGNSPPPVPQPVEPANGATGLDTTLVLKWSQLPDVDGDAVTNLVYLSTAEDFSGVTPIEVVAVDSAGRGVLLAGGGGLMVFLGVAVGLKRRNRRLLVSCLAVAALMMLLSCGGGGGGGGGGGPVGELRSQSIQGLAANTVYFWKVAAEDGLGGRAESGVMSFSTR